MLSKCSNPDCSAHFLYLNRGKLFRFVRRNAAYPEPDSYQRSSPGFEFFWLCETCAGELTLEADAAHGIHVVSIHRKALAARAAL